jgi:opacity protein-like surface antigen
MTRLFSLTFAVLLFTASAASAQGFISGFVGTAFSKPPLEACSFPAGCVDGQRTYGFAVGGLGSIFGAEFDLGYTKAFFGETGETALNATATSGLTTMMGNIMLAPKIGFVQPYGLAGIGVMRMQVDSLTSTFTESDETKLAWDIGGGVIIFLGRHVGIRGDIRHIRGKQDLELLAQTIEGSSVRFNRAAASLVLKF